MAVFAKDPALSMFYLGEHELTLVGTMMYRHEDFVRTVENIATGTVHLEPLITDRFAFEDYDKAYKHIRDHRAETMKVMIEL